MCYPLKDKMNLDLKMERFLFTNVPKDQEQTNKCQAPQYSMLRQDLQRRCCKCSGDLKNEIYSKNVKELKGMCAGSWKMKIY